MSAVLGTCLCLAPRATPALSGVRDTAAHFTCNRRVGVSGTVRWSVCPPVRPTVLSASPHAWCPLRSCLPAHCPSRSPGSWGYEPLQGIPNFHPFPHQNGLLRWSPRGRAGPARSDANPPSGDVQIPPTNRLVPARPSAGVQSALTVGVSTGAVFP